MDDPAKDGASIDYWSSGVGVVDVHYSSGIGNRPMRSCPREARTRAARAPRW
ncbi:hypothetical protein ACN28S_26110 [Cystobacter fuscus]